MKNHSCSNIFYLCIHHPWVLVNKLNLFLVTVIFFVLLGCLPVDASILVDDVQKAHIDTQSGVIHLQQGDYSTAYDSFTQAINTDPNDNLAYSNRCLTDIYLEKYELAILDCSKSLELKPTSKEAYLNRGLAAYRLGDYDAAIADNTHVLELTLHDPRAYYNRGLAYVGQGAYRKALVDYGEALRQLSPLERTTIAQIQNDRGVAYLMLQQHRRAIEAFSEAIQMDGSDARSFFNRGCAYHQQGNLVAALSDFTHVTAIDPQYAEAYLNQGLLQQQLGDKGSAIASLQYAVTLFKQQHHLADYLKVRQLLEQLQFSLTALA